MPTAFTTHKNSYKTLLTFTVQSPQLVPYVSSSSLTIPQCKASINQFNLIVTPHKHQVHNCYLHDDHHSQLLQVSLFLSKSCLLIKAYLGYHLFHQVFKLHHGSPLLWMVLVPCFILLPPQEIIHYLKALFYKPPGLSTVLSKTENTWR